MVKGRKNQNTEEGNAVENVLIDDESDEEMAVMQHEELKKVKILKIIKEKNRVSGN